MPHEMSFQEREAWEAEQLAWLSTLPPSPVPDFLTGMKPRPPDSRDFDLADDPRVAEALVVGFPESGDLTGSIKGVYNQGSVPSCVSHTAAACMSIFQQQEEGIWRTFDAPLVHSQTGSIGQGRYATDILKYAQAQGMPVVGSGTRYKIEAYAFAQPGSGWADTIKAALSTGRPVWICFLIPASFGWESGGGMTQGYHEVLVVGWRTDAFLILNSWGAGWGRNGLGWMPISYLQSENYHRGLTLAHTVTDVRDNAPPPPPPSEVTILNLLDARGQPIREIDQGAVAQVIGTGFATLGGSPVVMLGLTPTTTQGITDTQITVTVAPTAAAQGPITIASGGRIVARSTFSVKVLGDGARPPPPPPMGVIVTGRATGSAVDAITVGKTLTLGNVDALLVVTDVQRDGNPPPRPTPRPTPTPGELSVIAQVVGNGLYVKGMAGDRYVTVDVSATSATVQMQAWHTQSIADANGSAAGSATFKLSGNGAITVTVRTADGRTGSTTVTV